VAKKLKILLTVFICLKNVKKFPVEYVANKKAWMTSDIFKQYVSKWNNELENKNKKKYF
jgi:hypothetical protein